MPQWVPEDLRWLCLSLSLKFSKLPLTKTLMAGRPPSRCDWLMLVVTSRCLLPRDWANLALCRDVWRGLVSRC